MGGGGDVASLAALVLSGVALGGIVGFLAISSRRGPSTATSPRPLRRRHRRRRDDDSSASEDSDARPAQRQAAPRRPSTQHLPLQEDVEAGISTGFSMEEAREKADADHEKCKSLTPGAVLESLQRGNTRFWLGAARRPEVSAFERRALISKQFPVTAVLGCSDSRVPVEIIFDQGLGDMFVVRVAGNCLDNTTTASLEYAVQHLHVKVLLVLGHEGCGAIKAAQVPMSDIQKEPKCLGDLLCGLREGLTKANLSAVRDAKAKDREAVTTNVKRQVEALVRDEAIMAKVRAKELIVVGAFYEISSGIVDFFHEVSDDVDLDPASPVAIKRQPSRGVLSRFGDDLVS